MQIHSTASRFDGSNARSDTATAELVERGVEFHKTLGKTVATAYFKKQNLPVSVIERILNVSAPRRAAQAGPPASGPGPAPRPFS
ncbi:hypothetical protein [Janthinobacterium fluminis]|uniref:Uncharacterized protein n=1 Tax=Janthinobacterium fluminis TaxID=2987524 RepID=A0ABT5K574_9BURK|nr:hypothetical protein [Janthinobacterium fluminis]MDC8760034.1 hypothetical protein [Janthinobacterium fluminis]